MRIFLATATLVILEMEITVVIGATVMMAGQMSNLNA